MTHLTKIEPRGLFDPPVQAHPTREAPGEMAGIAISTETTRPFAVGVDQAPTQARAVRDANWPGYDWPSVSNLTPRMRGKRY